MGYVDDYLGGYENLYRYTDDNNKLDFEGAYMSGLDGYGLESSSWGGLDAWGADDAALYKGSVQVHCTGCGELLNDLQKDCESFHFGSEGRDLQLDGKMDTESKDLQWVIDNELHTELWPGNAKGIFLLACSTECASEYIASTKEEERKTFRGKWLSMLSPKARRKYEPRPSPALKPRKAQDSNQRCPFANNKNTGLCGNPPAKECANDACAKHCKKVGKRGKTCERHAPGWENRQLSKGL